MTLHKLIIKTILKYLLPDHQVYFLFLVLFPLLWTYLCVLCQLGQIILCPSWNLVYCSLQTLFSVLINFILLVLELSHPWNHHPILTNAQLIQQSQVHAINQTSMKGVNQMLKILFMVLFNFKTTCHIFYVKKLKFFKNLLWDSNVRMRMKESTWYVLRMRDLKHFLFRKLPDS